MTARFFLIALVLLAASSEALAGTTRIRKVGNYDQYYNSDGSMGTGYAVGDRYYYSDTSGNMAQVYGVGDTDYVNTY